jgi:hypothetical protein
VGPPLWTLASGDDTEIAAARRALTETLEAAAEERELEAQRRREKEAARKATPVVRMARALRRIPIAVGPRAVVLEEGDQLPADHEIVKQHAEDFTVVPPPVDENRDE